MLYSRAYSLRCAAAGGGLGRRAACGAFRRAKVLCSAGGSENAAGNGQSRSLLRDAWLFSLDGPLVVDDEKHKAVVQQAHRDGTLSFGFSAGGCLFPYYLGVSGALQDAGVLKEETKVGGASAGSLIAACVKSGMVADEVVEQCMRLMRNCRVNGTMHRLGPLLEALLEESLPPDAHIKCQDRAFVAVSRALPSLRGELVSRFESREDLIRALRASCHIPYYLDGQWYTDFRGMAHVDGGLTNFIPIPPNTVGIRVCCFPSKQLSRLYRIGISPDSFEPWPYTLAQTIRWALEPASEELVAVFIEKGRRDAMAWCEAQGLLEEKAGAEAAARGPAQQGQVAAAKEAATGAGEQAAEERREWEGLEARAVAEQQGQSGASALGPAEEAAGQGGGGSGQEEGAGGGAGMLAKAAPGVAGVAAAAAAAMNTLGGPG